MGDMFISGVNPALYISDPSQLVVGMQLWNVGQGGICKVSKPWLRGTLVAVDESVDYTTGKTRNDPGNIVYQPSDWNHLSYTSMKDRHILPQEYNNWYMCRSEEDANQIYDYLADIWVVYPKYEQARQQFKDECDRWDRL